MFEEEVNPYRRYKRHTDPDHERDVEKYSQALKRDGAYTHKPGRQPAGEKSIPTNYTQKGADILRTTEWLEDWHEGRQIDLETEESWDHFAPQDWVNGEVSDNTVLSTT